MRGESREVDSVFQLLTLFWEGLIDDREAIQWLNLHRLEFPRETYQEAMFEILALAGCRRYCKL